MSAGASGIMSALRSLEPGDEVGLECRHQDWSNPLEILDVEVVDWQAADGSWATHRIHLTTSRGTDYRIDLVEGVTDAARVHPYEVSYGPVVDVEPPSPHPREIADDCEPAITQVERDDSTDEYDHDQAKPWSKTDTKEDLQDEIRSRLNLRGETTTGVPTASDLREIYAALGLGSKPSALRMQKAELLSTVREELGVPDTTETPNRTDLEAILEALPEDAGTSAHELPSGIDEQALRSAADRHDTLRGVAEAVGASTGATRSALFSVDLYREVREGGPRSGTGSGGESA